ncbi:arginase family protein [Pantoea dispersa]|uniref:arginase family protein n=1 Tax=Pantoea dispersa TaxID=59814 RepID=UPI000FD7F692|nr:hypothetical protein EKH82_16525 [Pantoea dispersa]
MRAAALTLTPVSYTHLDVYKRQDIDCLDPAHAPGTGTPVSYTHLDVYKRQRLSGGAGGCPHPDPLPQEREPIERAVRTARTAPSPASGRGLG